MTNLSGLKTSIMGGYEKNGVREVVEKLDGTVKKLTSDLENKKKALRLANENLGRANDTIGRADTMIGDLKTKLKTAEDITNKTKTELKESQDALSKAKEPFVSETLNQKTGKKHVITYYRKGLNKEEVFKEGSKTPERRTITTADKTKHTTLYDKNGTRTLTETKAGKVYYDANGKAQFDKNGKLISGKAKIEKIKTEEIPSACGYKTMVETYTDGSKVETYLTDKNIETKIIKTNAKGKVIEKSERYQQGYNNPTKTKTLITKYSDDGALKERIFEYLDGHKTIDLIENGKIFKQTQTKNGMKLIKTAKRDRFGHILDECNMKFVYPKDSIIKDVKVEFSSRFTPTAEHVRLKNGKTIDIKIDSSYYNIHESEEKIQELRNLGYCHDHVWRQDELYANVIH